MKRGVLWETARRGIRLKSPQGFAFVQMLRVIVIIGQFSRHSFRIAGICVDAINEADVAAAPIEVWQMVPDGDKITAFAALRQLLHVVRFL